VEKTVELIPENIEVLGVPRHVESWTVAKIPGFVSAVLNRWHRAHSVLPHRFYMVLCPQVEVNAIGGLPAKVYELTDPRLRCRHFTGCHKPYFVVFLTGEDADQRRAEIQTQLSWSEGYEVEMTPEKVRLKFAEATEDCADELKKGPPTRTIQQLLATGELVSILE
jgi:hypothetical protein